MDNISTNIKAWPIQEAVGLKKHLQNIHESKNKVTFQTGYGPSGLPHIGTFGEVARTTMMINALKHPSLQEMVELKRCNR